jgi:hypothetical protein
LLLRNQMGHIANRQLGRSQRCVRLAAARVCSGETRPQACGSGPRWFEGISTSASSPSLSREEPLTRAVSTGAVRAPSVLSGCGLRRDAVAHRRSPRAGRTVAGDRPAPRRTRPALPGRLGSPGRLSRRAPACAGPAGGVASPDSCGQGHAIRNWAAALRAACYLGDDLGDLSAFAALDQLVARGIATTRIAVRSDEAPAELLQAADMISTPLRAPPSCCRRCCSRRDGAMRAPPHCGNLFAAPWPLAGGERDVRQNG